MRVFSLFVHLRTHLSLSFSLSLSLSLSVSLFLSLAHSLTHMHNISSQIWQPTILLFSDHHGPCFTALLES